jgi:trimethylguanosine synthase
MSKFSEVTSTASDVSFTTAQEHLKGKRTLVLGNGKLTLRAVHFKGVKCPGFPPAPKGVPVKYWMKRLNLFSKFDEGIHMDDFAWFETTPEAVAKHIALSIKKLSVSTVLDGCCGVGSACIQLALQMRKVVILANDLSEDRVEMSRHNAKVYNVFNRIKFQTGDFCEFGHSKRLRFSSTAVFLSPPWGGPSCNDLDTFSIFETEPLIADMMRHALRSVGRHLVVFLPKHTRLEDILKISTELGCSTPPLIETVVYALPKPHCKGILVYMSQDEFTV